MPDERDKLNELRDVLEQDARTRKVSRMVPISGPLTPAKRGEIIDAAKSYMAEHGLSQGDLARGCGHSSTYVNNALTGAGNIPVDARDDVLRDLNNWLDRDFRARQAQRPTGYIRTEVALRLKAVADELILEPDMAIVFGPAGIGKTTTCEALQAELGAVLVRCGHDSRSASGLLRALFNALGSRRPRSSCVRFEAVAEKLRPSPRVKTAQLVIIDQAHELSIKALGVLMELHDVCRCSVLLVGTRAINASLADDDDPHFGQLSSRIGRRIELAPELTGRGDPGRRSKLLFTVADIRALFQTGKIRLSSDAARLLVSIAHDPARRGALRRVKRIGRLAERYAQHEGAEEVTVKHVQSAAVYVDQRPDLPEGFEIEQPVAARKEATA